MTGMISVESDSEAVNRYTRQCKLWNHISKSLECNNLSQNMHGSTGEAPKAATQTLFFPSANLEDLLRKWVQNQILSKSSSFFSPFSHSAKSEWCTHFISVLSQNRTPGSYVSLLYFNTSPSCSLLTVKTNHKVLWYPTPISYAVYHWEPSGLLAKSQAHLPHPLTYWRTTVSYSCFLLFQPQCDPYGTFCYHSSMMLFHTNSNHFPLTFPAPAFWDLHL